MEIGYKLSSEEHGPLDLVAQARRAEAAGMTFAMISDHYHPWIDRQGHSPFVWNVIGGVAVTTGLRVITGVTCPIIRIHPAILAQAAATSAAMMPGRFVFGVGSGEHLNEHVLGDKWPPLSQRLEMLEEAVEVIRKLWTGRLTTHRGRHYTVENARVYTLPEEPPPIAVAGAGPKAAELAGRIGDAYVGVSPERELIETFESAAGGTRGPRYCEVWVCWAPTEEQARRTVMEWWPQGGLPGQLSQELALPSHFEQAVELVEADSLCSKMACGPDPEVHLESIRRYADAGYDHIAIHQIGPDQDGFFDFYEKEVLPRI